VSGALQFGVLCCAVLLDEVFGWLRGDVFGNVLVFCVCVGRFYAGVLMCVSMVWCGCVDGVVRVCCVCALCGVL